MLNTYATGEHATQKKSASAARLPRSKTASKTFLDTVQTPSQLLRYQELVYKAFCVERDWLNPDDYPDNRVSDPHDKYADMVTVLHNDSIVAGMRLVYDSPLQFPHENLCKIVLPDSGIIADARVYERLKKTPRSAIREVSRFASVGLGMRCKSMTIELVRGLHWFAHAHNVQAYFMVIDIDLLKLCSKIHIPIHRIGEDFHCEGSTVMPGILFPDEMSAMRKKSHIWKYIINPHGISANLSSQTPLAQ